MLHHQNLLFFLMSLLCVIFISAAEIDFSFREIKTLESDRNPTESLLRIWGCQNVTVYDLYKVLHKVGRYEEMKHLEKISMYSFHFFLYNWRQYHWGMINASGKIMCVFIYLSPPPHTHTHMHARAQHAHGNTHTHALIFHLVIASSINKSRTHYLCHPERNVIWVMNDNGQRWDFTGKRYSMNLIHLINEPYSLMAVSTITCGGLFVES